MNPTEYTLYTVFIIYEVDLNGFVKWQFYTLNWSKIKMKNVVNVPQS